MKITTQKSKSTAPSYLIGLCLIALLAFAPLGNAQTTNYFYDGFETAQSLDDWSANNGTWEIGVPTFGPPTNSLGRRAFAGTNCAATVLAGNYGEGVDSRLERTGFVVPPANQNPRLRFWHWFSFSSFDAGVVQIKVGVGNWTNVSPQFVNTSSGAWTSPSIDLRPFAGQNIQVGFRFTSTTCGGCSAGVSSGWYIDDVTVVTGPTQTLTANVPDSFELGLGDWSAEGGTWEVGKPTSGPGSAHAGTNCAATKLTGNYDDFVDTRLVSPTFIVPPAASNPRLRFWHWFSFSSFDVGVVQIKVGTNSWQDISSQYNNTSSAVWSSPSINLSAYAGQSVQLGFRFTSTTCGGCSTGVSPGWYIDEVRLLHDFTLSLLNSPIVRTQNMACVSLGIAASSPLSTMNFTMDAPAGNLGSLMLNTEGCWTGSITPQPNSQWLVSLQSSCTTTMAGVQTIGSICFTAISAQSAFVPISINDLAVTNLDASLPPTHSFGSRAVIIANEPLLEAGRGPNRQRILTTYGKANTTYQISYATNLVGNNFSASTITPALTNIVPASLFHSQALTGILSNAPTLFLQAKEQ